MDRRGFLGGAIAGAASFASVQAEQTKGELRTAQYAIVELMGYKKLCGRLSQGIAGMLQLDVPVEGGIVTQFINPNSVYRITIVDEAVVRDYARHVDPLPAIELEIPPRQQAITFDRYDNGEYDRD